MPCPPKTFEVRTSRPDLVVDAAARHSAEGFPAGILLLAGALADEADNIARDLAVEVRGTTWTIASCAGVLTGSSEFEGENAAVGLMLPTETQMVLAGAGTPEFGEELSQRLKANPGSSALILMRGDGDDGWLEEMKSEGDRPSPPVFGGGTLPGRDIYSVSEGVVRSGAASATMIPRARQVRYRSSSACRLISPLGKITKARGKVIHSIDNIPALELLNQCASDSDEHPLVLLAIAGGEQPLSPEGRTLALRAIQGVDPGRGALIVSDDVPSGTRVAFAVRDAHSARTDLEAQLRGLARSCAGAAPDFGIYVNCAGRGQGLYGTPDVDIRLIRKVFGEMPVVGLHSTFELAPLADQLVPQIYTGVLGVYCRPS